MVALRDFSGLVSSPWALARPLRWRRWSHWSGASADLHFHQIKADRTGFRSLGPKSVAGRFLGIFRHQFLEVGLGAFVLLMGGSGPAEGSANSAQELEALISTIRTASSRGRGGSTPNSRGSFAALDAAPELLLRREEQMLVQRIGMDGHFDPFAAAGDDRQHRGAGIRHPHVVLQLRHVLFGSGLLRERPGQHEFGLEYGPAGSTRPSRVAAIHLMTGCWICRWTSLT